MKSLFWGMPYYGKSVLSWEKHVPNPDMPDLIQDQAEPGWLGRQAA